MRQVQKSEQPMTDVYMNNKYHPGRVPTVVTGFAQELIVRLNFSLCLDVVQLSTRSCKPSRGIFSFFSCLSGV